MFTFICGISFVGQSCGRTFQLPSLILSPTNKWHLCICATYIEGLYPDFHFKLSSQWTLNIDEAWKLESSYFEESGVVKHYIHVYIIYLLLSQTCCFLTCMHEFKHDWILYQVRRMTWCLCLLYEFRPCSCPPIKLKETVFVRYLKVPIWSPWWVLEMWQTCLSTSIAMYTYIYINRYR